MSKEAVKMEAVTPAYAIGEQVEYVDHHNRVQIGEVRAVEARWDRIYGTRPSITFTISHPTYRNKRIHTGYRDILGRADRLSQGA